VELSDDDQLLPLSQLAKLLPVVRGNKPPNRSTLYRWATTGLKSRSGQRIRLEAQFIGGTLCASLEDVRRLCDQKDDIDFTPSEYRSQREEQEMRQRAEAARSRLRAVGFLRPEETNPALT
jgi:hypothetical protein